MCRQTDWIMGLCFDRIIRWFAKEFGVKLNKFIMYDDNTFYLVREQLKKTYEVKANPDILNYILPPNERGKSAYELLQKALKKVCRKQLYPIFIL